MLFVWALNSKLLNLNSTKMKTPLKTIFPKFSLLTLLSIACWACNDNPDAYIVSKGNPVISHFRVTDATKKDSVVTQSYMGTTVAVVGENLRSIVKVLFNDQEVILNTSFITPTSMILRIPNSLPKIVSNKAYFIAQTGDTVSCNFKVDVPAPTVTSMICEYVSDGQIATFFGDYFVNDPSHPLEVIFPNAIKATEIVSISKTEIKVKVPTGSDAGKIKVKSAFGEGVSNFMFRDNRSVILDFDNSYPNSEWGKTGVFQDNNPAGISGNYVCLKDQIKADNEFKDATLMCEYDGKLAGFPEGNLFSGNPDSLLLKFEVNIPTSWKAGYLQCIFTPWGKGNADRFALYHDVNFARILWRPWQLQTTGSYSTNGWITVSIPLSQAVHNPDGSNGKLKLDKNAFGNITFFVWGGSDSTIPKPGTASDINICIDNIRVVPMK